MSACSYALQISGPQHDYEPALLQFHASLGASPPAGVRGAATYRASGLPWLNKQPCYEDWCFLTSSTVLEELNRAAVIGLPASTRHGLCDAASSKYPRRDTVLIKR